MAEEVQQQTVDSDPNTRPLRIGDLVRVSELGIRKSKRLNDKEKSLGRVMNIIVNDDSNTVYEIEWILEGSRLQACEREDLRWTSADEEGMTYSRSRAKRKPVEFMQYVEQIDRQKKQKKVTEKKVAEKKVTEKKRTTTKKRKEPSVPVPAVAEPTPPPQPPEQAAATSNGLDMYERHRRELERFFTRIKDRVDVFHHFWDEPPLGLDETYEDGKPQKYPSFAPYNWEMMHRRMKHGRYIVDRRQKEEDERYTLFADHYSSIGRRRGGRKKKAESDARVLNPKGVHWDLFQADVFAMCDAAVRRRQDDTDDDGQRGTLSYAVKKIKETVQQTVERTGKRHAMELDNADDRHKYSIAVKRGNDEAAMQSWRKEPFPERRYERLTADAVCDGLSTIDERIAQFERKTSLPDRFIGQAYLYDDTGESETWMRSVVDETAANDKSKKNVKKKTNDSISADDEVIRAQVSATMQSMLISVQDTVMTKAKVMHQPELHSENWLREAKTEDVESDIIEQPVWGIDCYTRKNILHCLEIEFDAKTALRFVEKWLLPAVNACPNKIAHDIGNAARILMDLPFEDGDDIDWTTTALGKSLKRKIVTKGPLWLKPCAHELLRARNALGLNFFRVHPKGHGSVVLANTIPSNNLVTFYRGELYPSWRWGEKMDAIEITQKRKHLKPALPDFYNMIMERPHLDPRGYGILFVDASRKGGHGSSLSHSCDPTCEVRVASRNGELCLAMTTLRELEMGEELTFDYNAVTESLNEYRSAVCLCGYGKCRGSFLHFATADCYQQVLNRNSPIAARFANLVRGSMKQVMSEDDTNTLKRHGFSTAAFGAISVNRRKTESDGESTLADSLDVVPVWLRTYVAETLRYIEYERRALPIALICEHISDSNNKESTENDLRKEPQTETPFLYFSRTQRAMLSKALTQQGFPESMNRFKRMHAMKKVASAYWAGVSEDKKKYWRDEAKKDYDKKYKAWQTGQKQSTKKQANTPKPLGTDDLLRTSKISFKDADNESVAAMEQRIQQLTQSLSRVGRVLDRHRETMRSSEKNCGDETDVLRKVVQAPLRFLSDIEVIDWMWNNPDGLIKSLMKSLGKCDVVRPHLMQSLDKIRAEFNPLLQCAMPAEANDNSNKPCSTRHQLKRALLAIRTEIIKELKLMSKDYKIALNEQKTSQSMSRSSSVPASEDEAENMNLLCAADKSELHLPVDLKNPLVENSKWINRYGRRFVLRAAADVLLLYANTSTFFILQPYTPLESTPVNVFARELGNSVPRTVIDKELGSAVELGRTDSGTEETPDCAPEDIVASVSIRYQGEYVLSQLLQWYNAGIGLPPGLPDLLGCAILPRVADCFDSEIVRELKAKSDRKTVYENKVVPALVSWLQDPLQRGSSWPPSVQRAFNGPELRATLKNPGEQFLPLGSPVIDFLVTGNESNITAILKELDASDKFGPGETDRTMLASVDKGRPAQAVSTWVQCENPKCQKWRRVPWHVDRDTLPEKFECKDNRWNPKAQSCDSPEDDWDASDALVGDDGKVEGTPIKREADENLNVQSEKSFAIGARFDVLKDGQDTFTVAKVTKVDFSGSAKRIMFHYVNTASEQDEWIPFGSSRIAPLNSKRCKAKKSIFKIPARPRKINTGDPKDITSFVVGARFDVLRTEKNRFFKAVVKEIDSTCVPMKVLFHFLKTSSNADEWAEYGSDRIRPYKSAVPPTTKEQKRQLANKRIDEQPSNCLPIVASGEINPGLSMDPGVDPSRPDVVQSEAYEEKNLALATAVEGKPSATNGTALAMDQGLTISGSSATQRKPQSNPKTQETSSIQTDFVQSHACLQLLGASTAAAQGVSAPPPTSLISGGSEGTTTTGQPTFRHCAAGPGLPTNTSLPEDYSTSFEVHAPAPQRNTTLPGAPESRLGYVVAPTARNDASTVLQGNQQQGHLPSAIRSVPPLTQANCPQANHSNAVGSVPTPCESNRQQQLKSALVDFGPSQCRTNGQTTNHSTFVSTGSSVLTGCQANRQQTHQSNTVGSPTPRFETDRQQPYQSNTVDSVPPPVRANRQHAYHSNLSSSVQPHFQPSGQHVHQPNLTGPVPPSYQPYSQNAHQPNLADSDPTAYRPNSIQTSQVNLADSAPPTYQSNQLKTRPPNLDGSEIQTPAARCYAQGFQTMLAGPRQSVPQLGGRPTGMPPPVVCNQLKGPTSASATQGRPNVQNPPLSGLDVLAMISERLEEATEQQPNLSPEQALKQYMQSHR